MLKTVKLLPIHTCPLQTYIKVYRLDVNKDRAGGAVALGPMRHTQILSDVWGSHVVVMLWGYVYVDVVQRQASF